MPIRQAFRSGTFYPDNQIEIKAFIEKNLMEYKVEDKINKVLGRIVPHAGWFYSGSTAMKVFLTLKEKFKGKTDTFIMIIGSVLKLNTVKRFIIFFAFYYRLKILLYSIK